MNKMFLLRQARPITLVRIASLFLLIIAATGVFASGVRAESYESFNGNFRIDLPDDWDRMDYRTVDYFLRLSSNGNELLEYEAVFSPSRPGVFYDREYLMLTIDTIGQLSRRQIDSVLSDMGDAFELPLERKPITDFANDVPAGKFLYDDKRQLAVVTTEVFDAGEVYKISLLAVKFYSEGTANFYFFSPDTVYNEMSNTFHRIVQSFTTENLGVTTATPVPVADIKHRSSDQKWIPYAIAAGIALLLAGVLMALRKRSSVKKV